MKTPVNIEFSATAVLMAVAVGVGAFVIWRGAKALGSVVDYVGEKVEAAKEAVIDTAITAVEPLSANKTILDNPTLTTEEQQWQNDQLNVWAMGNMGA